MPAIHERMQADLAFVYGEERANAVWPQLLARVDRFRAQYPMLHQQAKPANERVSEADVVLITYGDQIQTVGEAPLNTLDETLQPLIGDTINSVHILPFYPYTADDGFSVVDYKQVHPEWGTWADVQDMSNHFRLMFDAVINHISQASD